MGITKTINALGENSFYSADYIAFAKSISLLFKVNLNVHFLANYEDDYENYEKDNEHFDFCHSVTYNLPVYYNKLDENKSAQPNNVYCDYELYIPVKLLDDNQLLLEFLSNGIFQLNFIPLGNMWQFFIEDIIGNNNHYYNSRDELVKEKGEVRNTYISILKKINCNRVALWTDAYYKTNEFLYCYSGQKKSLQDIMQFMHEADNIKFYNFSEVINKKIAIISENNNHKYIDIALIDDFNDKIELNNL